MVVWWKEWKEVDTVEVDVDVDVEGMEGMIKEGDAVIAWRVRVYGPVRTLHVDHVVISQPLPRLPPPLLTSSPCVHTANHCYERTFQSPSHAMSVAYLKFRKKKTWFLCRGCQFRDGQED
jgi:hypothetical protein